MKFFRDIFTDDDGNFDIVIAMATLAMVTYIALSCFNVFWLKKDILYTDWAAGAGAMIVSLGGAYKLKRKPRENEQ